MDNSENELSLFRKTVCDVFISENGMWSSATYQQMQMIGDTVVKLYHADGHFAHAVLGVPCQATRQR